jgi:hypothetical protein
MSFVRIPIRFAGSLLGEYRHVCAFFASPEEEYGVLLPFIREGLARGERAYHVVDPSLRNEHLARLSGSGIDVEHVQREGQLEVHAPADTYLRGGKFEKEAMLVLVQSVLLEGLVKSAPLTRLIAHAECVSGDPADRSDWIEYEARLNYVLSRFDDPVICAYDLRLVDASLAFDILRTHPVVYLAGALHENPFYVRPEELVPQLLRERSGSNGRSNGRSDGRSNGRRHA